MNRLLGSVLVALAACASPQPQPAPAKGPAPFLQGVVVPMVTPFKTDGSLDEAGLTALTAWLCKKPIDGLFPMGSSGEFKHLSLAERKRVTELVIAEARRPHPREPQAPDARVLVVPGVGAPTLEETLELARHAESCRADGVGVIVPEETDLVAYFSAIDQAVGIPILIYDPRPTITPELMERLSQLEGVRAIKYRSKDMRETMRVVVAAGGRVALLAGHEQYLLPTLAVGGVGVVGGGSNLFPGIMSAVCRRWRMGNHDGALSAQRALDELGQAVGKAGPWPQSAKLLLRRMEGLPIEPVTREPSRALTPEEEQALEQAVVRISRWLVRVWR